MSSARSLRVFAPAKINLYLHVTGRLASGYHTLDSLIGFADIGDELLIEPAQDFSFSIEGPFAGALKGADISARPDSSNLVVRAVWALSRLAQKAPSFHITLTKNLPPGAGIGGGSADAAAALWGLLELWNLPKDPKDLDGLGALMLELGADVPVCFASHTKRVRGIGDILEDAPELPELPIVLVYPGKPCHTAKIFSRFEAAPAPPLGLPSGFETLAGVRAFLAGTQNVLSESALGVVPEIHNVLRALEHQKGCAFTRMSGSGSCCFGLFEDEERAQEAAQKLTDENPDWWVRSGWLGRCERY